VYQDNWKLVRKFIKTKGVIKQYTDSFNYFINVDIKEIVKANNELVSHNDPTLYLKYLDIRVGTPIDTTEDVDCVRILFSVSLCNVNLMSFFLII